MLPSSDKRCVGKHSAVQTSPTPREASKPPRQTEVSSKDTETAESLAQFAAALNLVQLLSFRAMGAEKVVDRQLPISNS